MSICARPPYLRAVGGGEPWCGGRAQGRADRERAACLHACLPSRACLPNGGARPLRTPARRARHARAHRSTSALASRVGSAGVRMTASKRSLSGRWSGWKSSSSSVRSRSGRSEPEPQMSTSDASAGGGGISENSEARWYSPSASASLFT